MSKYWERSSWHVGYISKSTAHVANYLLRFNPRTDGGLSHLRTAGGGGADEPPRDLEN